MCDCLCALGSAAVGGTAVFAKNSDRPPTEAQVLEWHPPRSEQRTATTYLEIEGHREPTVGFVGSRPAWMWGVEHGVNEAGLAVGNEAVFTTTDPTGYPPALVGMDLVRLALERARSAAEGVEVITALLERYGQGGSGHDPGPDGSEQWPYWSSFMLVDPDEAWVLETNAAEWEAAPVSNSRAISNRLTIDSFSAAHRDTSPALAALVDPRWEASKAALSAGPLDTASARRHLRSHAGGDDGWTVCMHVEGVEATTAAVVAELPRGRRPVARFLLGSPCRSVFVPVLVGHPLGDVPAWERFASLGARRSPMLDALEAELERGVAAAADHDDPSWNSDAWGAVAEVLDRIGAAAPAVTEPASAAG
jgi:hypothetical protein